MYSFMNRSLNFLMDIPSTSCHAACHLSHKGIPSIKGVLRFQQPSVMIVPHPNCGVAASPLELAPVLSDQEWHVLLESQEERTVDIV